MARRISFGRIVCSAIAAGLVGAAVYFAVRSWRMQREWTEWINARPVETSVDLSRPGKFTAPLRQTCQVSHGEMFWLIVEPPPASGKEDETLLGGLDATVTVTDSDGNEAESLEITGGTAKDAGEPIMLAYFHPFAEGDYTLTIDVRNGAPALAGRKQTFFARYWLCGMEVLPAAISGLLALVCGIPGLIMTVIVSRGFLKHGMRVSADDDPRRRAESE